MLCENCGYEAWFERYNLTDIKHETSDKLFKLKQCKNCNLFVITEDDNINDRGKFYPKNYAAFQELSKINGESYSREIINNYVVKGRLAWSKLVEISENSKVLDVGCGSGSIMYYLQNQYNIQITGVEPVGKAVEIGKSYGLNIIHSSIEDFEADRKYDLIYILHLIEHLKKPSEQIRRLHSMLSDSGTLVIGTPNANSLERVLFKKYWDGWDTPRHIYVFNPENITEMLRVNGFKEVKVYYEVYSLFQRSLSNLTNYKKLNNRLINKPITLTNRLLAKILPFLKYSGAIQVIAKK